MEGSLSKLLICFVEAQGISLSRSNALKVYIRDQVKTLQVKIYLVSLQYSPPV